MEDGCVNIFAIQKSDGEKYVFLYDDESRWGLCNIADTFAANPELSFTGRDASIARSKAWKAPPPKCAR